MQADRKESYGVRTRRVEADLTKLGIGSGLARKLIYYDSLSVLEKLIENTKERRPARAAAYLLNGLNRSRMKRRLQRSPMKGEEMS